MTLFTFAQENSYTEFSVEVGAKYTFMAKTSENGSYPCSGEQCYHRYDLNEAKILGSQGYIQFSYVRNRIMIPFGIGYSNWEENLSGVDEQAIKLFGTTYYDHTSLSYKSHTENANISTGFALNFFRSSEKKFFGPIFRANYTYLFGTGKVVTVNESQTTTATSVSKGNATDYLNVGEQSKHTLWPSLGVLFRFNTKKVLQFNLEAGYDWANRNSVSLGRIAPITGGIYAQLSLGFKLNKISKNPK